MLNKYFLFSLLTASSMTLFARDLCLKTETVYFTCETYKSKKIISLCGSQSLSDSNSYLNYRFGTLKKIELQFPQNNKNSLKKFSYAHYFRSKVDRTELSFENENTTYTIYKYDENESNMKPVDSAGVRITLKDQSSLEIKCRDFAKHKLNDLEPFVNCDEDNALNLNGCSKK